MKKRLLPIYIVLIFISLLLVSGCKFGIHLDPYKDAPTPTKDFTFNNYIDDGAIFSEDCNIIINGKCEPKVVITGTLFNENNSVASQDIAIADENGLFQITIKGKKASYSKYRLELSDGLHIHKFNDIMFGEVWLYATDMHVENTDSDITLLPNIKILKEQDGIIDFVDDKNISDVYPNAIHFANNLQENLDIPIVIIDASLENGFLDTWLDPDMIENNEEFIEYFDLLERDFIDKNTNSIGYMFNTYLKQLKNYNIDGVIFSMGSQDMKSYINKKRDDAIMMHSTLINSVLNNLKSIYENIDIYLVQEAKQNSSYSIDLIEAQAIASYAILDLVLIPTYDCYYINKDEVLEFNLNKYLSRIETTIYNNTYLDSDISIFSYTDILVKNNSVKLSFHYNYNLQEVSELYGLKIVDEFGEEVKYDYSFYKNTLTLNLKFNEEQIENNVSYKIYYGYVEDLYNCNLKNQLNIPAIPFKINIV